MSEKKVNTTKDAKEGQQITQASLDSSMKNAAKILGSQKEVEVFIPKYLKKRLGKNVPVGVQGAVIHVPVGKKVKIPEAMAEVLNRSLNELKL